MRFKVTLKKKGKEFDEVVIANNKHDAIKVALKNNPDSGLSIQIGHLSFKD